LNIAEGHTVLIGDREEKIKTFLKLSED